MDSDSGEVSTSGGFTSSMVACAEAGVAPRTNWLVLIVLGDTYSVLEKKSSDLGASLTDKRDVPSIVLLVDDGNHMHQPVTASAGD